MQCLVELRDMKTPIGDHADVDVQERNMILYFDERNMIDEERFHFLLSYSSKERVEYDQKYKMRQDRILSIVAFLVLRVGLFELFQISDMPQLLITDWGKPYIKNYPDIHFSISHCDRGVTCAFSTQSDKVGVDIQDIVKCVYKMARYFINDSEYDTLSKICDKDRYFTKLWTLKELYGKYQETGICYNMRETNIESEMMLKKVER